MVTADRVVVELEAKLNNYTAKVNQARTDFDRQMGRISKSATVAEHAVSASFARIRLGLAAVIGGAAAGALARNIVSTIVEFEKLRASLTTVTGSAANAEAAFAKIQKFAATTPFSVQEVTEAFIRLKSLGLDPSTEALTSYGNTSAAMGKTIIQFIEAVADASTGEFERLKEFGIKASQQGDKVSFTFQGVTTTVRKNAAEIEKYLQSIGNVQFAGGMERQAATLGGAFSNLSDSASALADRIGREGLAGALTDVARDMSDAASASQGLATQLGQGLGRVVTFISNEIKLLSYQLQLLSKKGSFADLGKDLSELTGIGQSPLDAAKTKLKLGIRDLDAGQGFNQFYDALGDRFKKDQVGENSFRGSSGKGVGGGSGRKRENAFKREIEQIQQRTQATLAETEAQSKLNPLVNDYGFTLEKTRAEQDLLNAAQEAGVAITPALREQIAGLAGAYAQASAGADRLNATQDEIRRKAEESAQFQKDLTRGIVDGFLQGKDAAEVFASALDKISAKLMDNVFDGLFNKGGFLSNLGGGKGGLFGGSIIPGILHSGGVAGTHGYGHGRSVSPAVFAGAPRYHSGGVAGLKPGEIPAILQKGEVVLPRNISMAKARSGNSTFAPVTHINISGSADQRTLTAMQRMIDQNNQALSKAAQRQQAGAWRKG